MGYIARLECGTRTLDLNTSRYSIDFTPPNAGEAIAVATGTSSNRYGGGQLVSRHGTNYQWTLIVKILGGSNNAVEQARQDLVRFVNLAGNEAEPLYLTWCSNNHIPYKPIWGQSGWRRVEIVYGRVTSNPIYSVANLRNTMQVVIVDLTCKPYILGLTQSVASGTGSFIENRIGAADGQPNGLYLYEAATNLVPNPVFMNYTAAETDWTATNVTNTVIVEKPFILPMSKRGVKLTSRAANGTYCATLTTASGTTYTVSAYVKKPDGSAVTAADCKIYFEAGAQTSTYISLGDGWYMVRYSVQSSTSAAQEVGLSFPAVGSTVYLGGLQCQASAYHTPLIMGDMLDCAWASTAHNSSTTSTAAKLNAGADAINITAGTIRVALKMECTQTSGNFHIFLADQSADLKAYFTAADDKINFTDGTNTISTAALTWAEGDVIILHFTWGLGQLAIYRAGVSVASGATYTPSTTPTAFYIGSTAAAGEQVRARWLDFTVYDRTITAAEALADATSWATLLASGGRANAIPWLWSDDGDNIIEAFYGTVSATGYETTMVSGGIAGDMPAVTVLDYDTYFSSTTTLGDSYLNIYSTPNYHHYTEGGQNYLFRDFTNTTALAGSANGYLQKVISVNATNFSANTALTLRYGYDEFAGKDFYVSGSYYYYGITLYPALVSPVIKSGAQTVTGDSVSVSGTGGTKYWNGFMAGPMRLPEFRGTLRGLTLTGASVFEDVNIYLSAIRSTTTSKLLVDWMQLHPGRMTLLAPGVETSDNAIVANGRVTGYESTAATKGVAIRGDPVELEPDVYNHLNFVMYGTPYPTSADADSFYGNRWNINNLYITPRWLVL